MKNYKNAYYSVCLYIKFPCRYELDLLNPNLGVWVQVQQTAKPNPWFGSKVLEPTPN